MMLNLRGKKCVVVGGGGIAADKITGLLNCGARVVVVSPRAENRIARQERSGRLKWRRRVFRASDVGGALLAITATNSPGVNEGVFRACRERGVLCNAVDDPEHCDFIYPAVVRRGPLQIAISTSGRSPALASSLRQRLEREFGPEWGAWVEHVGKARRKVLGKGISPEDRKAELLQLASAEEFRKFLRSYEQKQRRRKVGKRANRRTRQLRG
jgi:precorrin-2 dehydrogenase / sirohydrochlorin ferrochelatase